MNQRLSRVTSYYGATIVRQYHLAYEVSGNTKKSRLISITEGNGAGLTFPLLFSLGTAVPRLWTFRERYCLTRWTTTTISSRAISMAMEVAILPRPAGSITRSKSTKSKTARLLPAARFIPLKISKARTHLASR